MMETPKSVSELCIERGIDVNQLAILACLDADRVRAIVEGRWTPSPSERDKIAAAFHVSREQIAWGHRTSVEHIQGHGPQFGRSP